MRAGDVLEFRHAKLGMCARPSAAARTAAKSASTMGGHFEWSGAVLTGRTVIGRAPSTCSPYRGGFAASARGADGRAHIPSLACRNSSTSRRASHPNLRLALQSQFESLFPKCPSRPQTFRPKSAHRAAVKTRSLTAAETRTPRRTRAHRRRQARSPHDNEIKLRGIRRVIWRHLRLGLFHAGGQIFCHGIAGFDLALSIMSPRTKR